MIGFMHTANNLVECMCDLIGVGAACCQNGWLISFSGSLSHKMRYCVKRKDILKFLECISVALMLLLMYCGLGSDTFVREALTYCRTVLLVNFTYYWDLQTLQHVWELQETAVLIFTIQRKLQSLGKIFHSSWQMVICQLGTIQICNKKRVIESFSFHLKRK